MQTITTIGLDIAKSVFQVHGVDNDGKVVIRRQLKRRYVLAFFEKLQPCLVGPSLASPQRSGAKASRNYCGSSPIRATNGCPMLSAHVLPHWAANCSVSKSRSWILIE